MKDESYEENAQRELKEEINLEGELNHLYDFYFENERTRAWGRVLLLIM